MNNALNVNAGLMLLVSFAFTYSTAAFIKPSEGSLAYGWGFIFGRATAGVLLPFVIVWVVRAILHRKPMFTRGTYISWWVLFVILSIVSLLGSMLPPEA